MRLGRSAPKELTDRPIGLTFRKLADYSEGTHTRVKRWNPETGEAFLADPVTFEPKPWPLLGVALQHPEVPRSITISTSMVNQGRLEGWIELTGADVAHQPGGPPGNPWAVTHTFETGDNIIFHTVDGDLVYHIVHNPGKYADGDGARVDWFYRAELVSDNG